MARGRADSRLLAGLACFGGVAIVGGLGLGEWLLGDWWLGVGVAGAWAIVTVAAGLGQGRPPHHAASVPARSPHPAPRRPRLVPPTSPGLPVVVGPLHLDGTWVRVVAGFDGLRVEAWSHGAWRVAGEDLALLANAMPRVTGRRPPDDPAAPAS